MYLFAASEITSLSLECLMRTLCLITTALPPVSHLDPFHIAFDVQIPNFMCGLRHL